MGWIVWGPMGLLIRVDSTWLRWHPYGMPPSEFRALVGDPEHEGEDYILGHPTVANMYAGMVDIGPGMVLQF